MDGERGKIVRHKRFEKAEEDFRSILDSSVDSQSKTFLDKFLLGLSINSNMFPLGIYTYTIGGLIIGFGVAFVFVTTGLHATQSSFFSTTISYFSNVPYFLRKAYLDSREWRLFFAAGVILGALLYSLTVSSEGFWTTSVQWWRLLIGGFLVGFGTRLSSGCTSGHGISGIASLSTTSLYAVVTFIIVGIITAHFTQFLGVAP